MISIALYEPQIPQNTGNIARLCVGLDIDLILVGKPGFSLEDKYLKRAGLDYWEYLKISLVDSLLNFIEQTKNRRKILATTKGIKPYYNFQFQADDILVFGSETSGLPAEYIKTNFEYSITIPMVGKIRSLNLSNSVAIIAYFALHQIGYFNNFTYNNNYLDFIKNYNI